MWGTPIVKDIAPLRISATGYVSTDEGSVAAANAVFLRELLGMGHTVTFHSKPSFVDPRSAVRNCDGMDRFSFVDCTNRFPTHLAGYMSSHPRSLPGRVISAIEHNSYNRSVIESMRARVSTHCSDISLWLGTWAASRLAGVPTISFAQGPPGTDARSVSRHRVLIERLTSRKFYLQMRALAQLRMVTSVNLAKHSDHVIVGSSWSKRELIRTLNVADKNVSTLPYPIDLALFRPPEEQRRTDGPLRVLWLGRFVPRKRLDLFLDGLELAIRNGIDVRATVVGRSGFVPGFEKLLEMFPFQDRLAYRPFVKRESVPELFSETDVLAQPSDNEDFGSSVAESLACGVPVIVGATNGTADYLCPRSIRLSGDTKEEFATAISHFSEAKRRGELVDPRPSRSVAERLFDPTSVTRRLESILNHVASTRSSVSV